jgi:hypothetical protein
VELARDLQDYQLVDRDDSPCGRVDDLIIGWDRSGARVGDLLSGMGVVLDQLGAPGRLAKRMPIRALQSHTAIAWRQVRELKPHQVCLLPPRNALGMRRTGHPKRAADERLLTSLLQMRVIDAGGNAMGILDVRTGRADPPAAPRVTGFLCAPDPKLMLFGLKRHDGGLMPRPRASKKTRFVPWEAIGTIADAIRLDCTFENLPHLADAPDEDQTATRTTT